MSMNVLGKQFIYVLWNPIKQDTTTGRSSKKKDGKRCAGGAGRVAGWPKAIPVNICAEVKKANTIAVFMRTVLASIGRSTANYLSVFPCGRSSTAHGRGMNAVDISGN